MDEPTSNAGNFARQAATASVIAPILAFGIGIFLQPLLHGNFIGQLIFIAVSILLIAAGFILGVVALICMTNYGTQGILWKALAGTVLSTLFALSIGTVAFMAVTKQHMRTASVADNTMNSYDRNNVHFLYSDSWKVTESSGAENGNHATEQILIQSRDNRSVICISLYPASQPLLDLEQYGRKLVQDTGGSADPKVQQITGDIGGVNEPGLRLHFTSLRESGAVFTGDGDFYRLQTANHNVVINTLTRKNTDTIDSMDDILASIKIDGGSIVASRTTAASTTATDADYSKSDGYFIPAMDRVDMVHDGKRNILYITAGDSVLRYQLDTKSFLAPLTLGGDLRGIDISPDNSHLAVADAAGSNGRVRIHVVDLETGTDAPASFTADAQESGTYSVAYGADGQIWISSSMSGSGGLPMRKYNPPTRRAMTLQRVSQDTMLAASANRQCIGFAEAQSSPGTFGRILYRATQLPPQPMQSDEYLYEVAISRDGSQLAVPGYNSMVLAGAPRSQLKEREILGAVYHPQRDYLFVSQAGTSLISVYDTTNYSKVKDMDFGEQFEWKLQAFGSGRLKISQDGFYVFCTVKGGIRYMAVDL